MEGGRRESHMAQCWTQIIWSFENQSFPFVSANSLAESISSTGSFQWECIWLRLCRPQTLRESLWVWKNPICNIVLYNALGFCICKHECKSIPSLEGLQSPFQAAMCVRGMEGNQPGDRHGGCIALTRPEAGKSCFSHHHKKQCSRKVLWELCCAQGAVRICMCAWLLL